MGHHSWQCSRENRLTCFKRPKFGHTIINVPNSGHWILGGDEAGKFSPHHSGVTYFKMLFKFSSTEQSNKQICSLIEDQGLKLG